MPEIVVAGSLNLDIVATVERFPAAGETVAGEDLRTFPGGKGANQAYAAARLGARVAMVGRVGNDAAGETLIESLVSASVDTVGIGRDPDRPTGTAIIAVDVGRENRIIVIPGANGAFTPERLERNRELLARAAIVLLQLEIPLDTVLAAARWAREGGARVMLDPAPACPLPAGLEPRVDYLTPNLGELAALTGAELTGESPLPDIIDAARVLGTGGARKVIVKLGERGALLVSHDEHHLWPAFPAEPVDTTAAGDCFNAAFAAGLVSGRSEIEAGVFACAAAAISVTRKGAQASMPSRDEVEALLKRSV